MNRGLSQCYRRPAILNLLVFADDYAKVRAKAFDITLRDKYSELCTDIRPCASTKSSSSPLEKSKHRESSKSCKSCSGKLPVDGRGAQQGSMLSTLGLELSRVIDPLLTWKTASNGRQRAVRRARTSFTVLNRKNSSAKRSNEGKDLTDKDSKITGDMSVSESEKLGVSILGRRFSDTLGSVPIKKRRFHFLHSASPPHDSSYSDDSDHVLGRQPDSVVNEKQHSSVSNSGSGSEFSRERNFNFEKTGVNKCDAVDFSGISILAAAACDSKIEGEFLNVEVAISKVHFSEVQGVPKETNNLDLLPDEKVELVLHTSEDLAARTDLPFETSSSSALPSKESNEKSDGSFNLENFVNSSQTMPSKTMESSSRDVRFHWDLNTVMDTWDSHDEGLNSEQGANNNVSAEGDHNEVGNVEPFMDQVGFGDSKNGSTDSGLVDGRAHLGGGEQKSICALEVKIEENPGIFNGDSSADVKESKPCFFPEHGYVPAEWPSKDAKIGITDLYEETNYLINKDQRYSVSGDFPSPTRGAMVSIGPLRDSSLSITTKLEDKKAEALCINLLSKVGSENSSSYVVSYDNATVYPPNGDCEPQLGVDKEPVEVETNVQMEDVTKMRTHMAEKNESPPFESGISKSARNSMVCLHEGKVSEVVVDGNIFEQVSGCVISGVNINVNNASDETDHRETNACEHETSALDMKVDDTKCYAPTNDMDDIGLKNSLSNQRSCKNYTESCVIGRCQVASEDHLECDYQSDASQNDANEAAGMEKVELSGDDDSQYEDGELRESLGNCWIDDGEEGEAEHVDYGTDRDTDTCEAGSVLPASVNYYGNNTGLPDANDAHCGELGRNRSDTSKGLRGHLRTTGGSKHSEFGASNGNVIGDDVKAENYRGSIITGDSRMKMSGWDKLPGGGRSSGNGIVNTRIGSSRNHNDAFSDLSRAGGSMRRDVGSSLRRDLSSRTERMQSSDVSRSSDKPYFSTNRSNYRSGFNPRAERDADTRRSKGRSDWRGDHQHDSSAYSYHGSRNAAAAAVAKVESNGFVVAPDGTIIKAGAAGSSSHLTRRPAKPSSQNACHSPIGRGSIERGRSFGMHSGPVRLREMSPEQPMFMSRRKAVRYGVNHFERYRGPVPNDIIDSSSPTHRPISRTDRSFSPYRRPLHMSPSHSRSPSRSRTRSPHRWTSPRGRINCGMSRGPVLCRRSRSPGFKSEATLDNRTRASFREHMINYASLPRNHTSPLHSSRWSDGRKELPEHHTEYEYRRCPGRSPPRRVVLRGHRFASMESPGRTRPDEYYRSAIFGRLSEFVDFERGGARNDGMVDYRREHDDKYVTNGNLKRLRYDDKNGFRAQNLQPKFSEFERRERREIFDSGGDRKEPGDSPRRSTEGEGHGSNNANFKSFGARDGDDNKDVQRRPL